MDVSVILEPLLKMAFLILLPLGIFAAVFKSRWFKGKTGEAVVNVTTKLALDKNIYHLINDVTIPAKDSTTQIDHIIVSKFGVFVVETKNMKGRIFGGERQKTWTQSIYKKKTKFQNPLHQNYGHVKNLERLLDLQSDQLHSVVVFTGESEFKTKMPENVVRPRGYAEFVKSKTEQVFNDTEVQSIINQIESRRFEKSFKTNREHVKSLREKAR